MDRASIISIEEVCKRCELYTKHCGMLEYPSQCVLSGHFIDGYRRAEKDLALTWEDIGKIHAQLEDVFKETAKGLHDEWTVMDMYEEVSKRFNEQRKI